MNFQGSGSGVSFSLLVLCAFAYSYDRGGVGSTLVRLHERVEFTLIMSFSVLGFFLMVPWVCLLSVIVAFLVIFTHLLFWLCVKFTQYHVHCLCLF